MLQRAAKYLITMFALVILVCGAFKNNAQAADKENCLM